MSAHSGHKRRWRLLAAAVAAGFAIAALSARPAAAADFGFSVAFQGSNGHLWTVDRSGAPHDTGLGMAPGTNPAAVEACVAGRCPIEIAFQASTGTLWTLDVRTGTPTDTGLPMLDHTSPSISFTSGGAVEVAYHGANRDLWTYVAGVGGHDSGLSITGWSSPSISLPGQFRGPVIAYQTPSGGYLCLLTSDGVNSCPGSVMDPASSPSITYTATTNWPGDGAEVAYQSFDGFLCVYNVTTGSTLRTGLSMSRGTSPSVADYGFIGADGTDVIQTAFQASTSALWLATPALQIQRSWTVGMAAGTSPAAIEVRFDDGTGGPAIAFQGTDGRLWTVPATGIPASSGLSMAPGTSPAVYPTF
jgi:hypothetical protein